MPRRIRWGPRLSLLVDRDVHRDRLDEVRSQAQQHLALAQRLAHQRDLVVLEVAQTAVDQARGPARGSAADVALVDQEHAQAAKRDVAGDAGAVDARADDREVPLRAVMDSNRRACTAQPYLQSPTDLARRAGREGRGGQPRGRRPARSRARRA